ncbi:MarR family winged helix-turn-helix transcriptional regulator [uncultured Friedmanniella sp.]|uniref:MarR family winged helix-turn-helix transcriptional regulator n=1 Tax=uncultured Friedmanniella sp. TaxID=335381 RepID=UPI0035CA1241
MVQEASVGDLQQSVGYSLKQAATALRSAMDTVLRPLELTVPQYSCLEVLGQRPGLSNAELARATFVTRQAMGGVLRGLQERGLVTRPAVASHGRALPTELTVLGRQRLRAASAAVHAVERQMLSGLPVADQQRLLDDLITCTTSLTGRSVPKQ